MRGYEGYSEEEEAILEAQEEVLKEELQEEIDYCDVVRREVRFANFVSRSKGRGRRRAYPAEVLLLSYGRRYHLDSCFPYDKVAQELLHGREEPTRLLQDRIAEMVRKGR